MATRGITRSAERHERNTDNIFPGFRFSVSPASGNNNTISGRIGFQSVSDLESEVDVIQYEEYDNSLSSYSVPNRVIDGPITMSRGVDEFDELSNWHNRVKLMDPSLTQGDKDARGPIEDLKQDLIVTSYGRSALDNAGVPFYHTKSWIILRAWPSKLSVSGFDAQASNLLIQSVTFQHEGIYQLDK